MEISVSNTSKFKEVNSCLCSLFNFPLIRSKFCHYKQNAYILDKVTEKYAKNEIKEENATVSSNELQLTCLIQKKNKY